MTHQQPNNPLHGKSLQLIVNELVDHFGWKALGERINIRCFNNDPSVKSSLKFLRKTPWARTEVEKLYLSLQNNNPNEASPSTAASIWANRNR